MLSFEILKKHDQLFLDSGIHGAINYQYSQCKLLHSSVPPALKVTCQSHCSSKAWDVIAVQQFYYIPSAYCATVDNICLLHVKDYQTDL